MEQGSKVFQEQTLTKASSREAALQDVLHQTVIIVNSKKVEWERKMKAFKAQMDIQHQESASAQSKLDQKGQEFLKLTRSYNKLLKQKNHQSREISKESLETSVRLNNLKKKLEEFEAKLREWDEEKTIFQNHLMCLEAQQKLLSEKCNSFQSSPETSFPATTQKFLQEEEKPTKEFEECLNSHLEELQGLSENMLKKYTGLQQSKHA
ncbi:deuterosome assembly protein 1 [Tympanuchus pallidicinctus]|uniref:deuterosome assembly protein 1 n=1 Tax=Tympanuchus pallidicinctus TaxID=109042 RepID=UPI0022876E9E|nr:deuterosome assembly protein 1 [Tympanuchus pallidicinctus]